MIEKIKAFWSRLRIRWHVISAAVVMALPEILSYLGVIDLTPVLSHFLPEDIVKLVVSILPFALIFLKSAVHLDKPAEDDDE